MKVYAIVVSFNGMAWIERCLQSLQQSTFFCTIVCVDNASADDTAAFVAQYFPDVFLVQSKTNLGFGQANNIGLTHALKNNADYVFLLNQDAAVEPDTIGKLVKAQLNNMAFGILSPLHYNGSGSQLDLYFKKYLLESRSLLHPYPINVIDSNPPVVIETKFVNAAAWLLSAACIKATGGFDPIFFHYGEDDNYCQRVLFNRFKIGIFTGCKIYHDREQQLLIKELSPQQYLKKEWIFFLTNACDINRQEFRTMILKRFLRHCLYCVKSLLVLDREKIFFHFSMVKNIFLSPLAIAKSRSVASKSGTIPFL